MRKQLLAPVLLSLALACQAELLEGQVVGVADGDTITVLDARHVQHKIRLAGIDAPEKKQPFGQRSKESLSSLVFGKMVTVETHKKDRYGREVGKVVADGQDANLKQIERGMAWFYRQYQKELSEPDRQAYEKAEGLAIDQRLGLWRDRELQPPWEWRKERRY